MALARAFARAGRGCCWRDEPTGNLDQVTGDQVMDLLFALRAEVGTTLLLVTHDLRLADRCERRIQMANGVIV